MTKQLLFHCDEMEDRSLVVYPSEYLLSLPVYERVAVLQSHLEALKIGMNAYFDAHQADCCFPRVALPDSEGEEPMKADVQVYARLVENLIEVVRDVKTI